MNKVKVNILDIRENKVVKDLVVYFAVKDAALVFINSQIDAFEFEYGKIKQGVLIDDYHIFKATSTHELLIEVEWGKQ